jgi:hypothetical protein
MAAVGRAAHHATALRCDRAPHLPARRLRNQVRQARVRHAAQRRPGGALRIVQGGA